MNKTQTTIITSLAIILLLLIVGLGVLLYQDNDRKIKDMGYSQTVEAIHNRDR